METRASGSNTDLRGFSRKASTPPNPVGGEGAIVPTTLLALLCAMFVVLVIQHVMVFLSDVVIWIPTAATDYPRGARGISPEFADPSVETMIRVSMLRSATWHAAYSAFSYVVLAHFGLRWLGFIGVTAYTVGGLCAALAVAAYWSVLGYRLHWDAFVVDLACGAAAGLAYRLIARKRPAKAPFSASGGKRDREGSASSQ